MRLVATCLAAAFISAAPIIAQGTKPAANLERGQKLFVDQKCAICHSIDGKGNQKGPLDSVGANRKPEEIRQWLINPQEMAVKTKAGRKPPMPSYAKLAKEDVEALVAYLQTLKKKS